MAKELCAFKAMGESVDGVTGSKEIVARLAFIQIADISIIPPPDPRRQTNEAKHVTNNFKLLIAGCFAATMLGCGWSRPLFAPPGPVRYQQNNASYHDPYPDNDAGPEVDGGRPRDFEKPSAEPVRSRVYADRLHGVR